MLSCSTRPLPVAEGAAEKQIKASPDQAKAELTAIKHAFGDGTETPADHAPVE